LCAADYRGTQMFRLLSTRIAIVIAILIGFLPDPLSAEEFVVLASTASKYKVGDVIADGAVVEVPARKRLVLMSALGRSLTLIGPYAETPGTAGRSVGGQVVQALASLVRTTEEDATSVGAVRAANLKDRDEALALNISATGDYCLVPGSPVIMTRYTSDTGSKIMVTDVLMNTNASAAWPKEGRTISWPAKLKIADGNRYLATQSLKDTRTLLTLHKLPKGLSTDVELLLALAERDCTEQAHMLLAVIRREAGS